MAMTGSEAGAVEEAEAEAGKSWRISYVITSIKPSVTIAAAKHEIQLYF